MTFPLIAFSLLIAALIWTMTSDRLIDYWFSPDKWRFPLFWLNRLITFLLIGIAVICWPPGKSWKTKTSVPNGPAPNLPDVNDPGERKPNSASEDYLERREGLLNSLVDPQTPPLLSTTYYNLHKNDKVLFRGVHPKPLDYQWLLHLNNTAKLVASARGSEKVSFWLQQGDMPKDGSNRIEFLILVTANEVPSGWSAVFSEEISLADVFTKQKLTDLQTEIGNAVSSEEQLAKLRPVIRSALDRQFGTIPYWFQVYVYNAVNQP